MQRIIRRRKAPADPALEVLPNMEIGVDGAEDPIEAALMLLAEALDNGWFLRMTRFDERETVEWWRECGWRPGFGLGPEARVTVMTVLSAFAGILPSGAAPESQLTWPAGHFKFEYGGLSRSASVQSQRIPGGVELVLGFDDGEALAFQLASEAERRRICESMCRESRGGEGIAHDGDQEVWWWDIEAIDPVGSRHPLVPLFASRTRFIPANGSIQGSIRGARPGTRFIVPAGFYEENLEISAPVQLIGAGADRVHIHSKGRSPLSGGRVHGNCLRTGSSGSLIRGVRFDLNLVRSNPEAMYAVAVTAGDSVFEKCEITSNSLACVGVRGEHANPTFRGCTVHGGATRGFEFGDQSAGLVEDCDIVDNSGAGVLIAKGARPSILGCRIQRNGYYGVVADATAGGRVENCRVQGNARGAFGLMAGHSVLERDNQV